MDGKALLKATIFSKSHEYYQILSSLRAPHYCSMGDYNKYGGAAARLGKTAVGRAKTRLRRCPWSEEVVISACAGVVPPLAVGQPAACPRKR